jgi:ATP-binding cassette subfamily F protein uup
VIFVTHDRRFLDRVAKRIVELDRGRLTTYEGNFSEYEKRKAEALAIEEVRAQKFDKVLAQEEVWIRKGVEARRTRNEGRVRRLEALRTNAKRGASVSARSRSRSPRGSARAAWSPSWTDVSKTYDTSASSTTSRAA